MVLDDPVPLDPTVPIEIPAPFPPPVLLGAAPEGAGSPWLTESLHVDPPPLDSPPTDPEEPAHDGA